MKRETSELSTISGKKVTVKTYLTAREMQTINTAVIGDSKTDAMTNGKVSLPIAAGLIYERKVMDAAVESVDGESKDPVEKLLDLPNSEYADIKGKVYELLKINLKQAN